MKVSIISVGCSLLFLVAAVGTLTVPAYAQRGAVVYPVPAQWQNALTIDVSDDGNRASGWAIVDFKGRQWHWTAGGPITLGQSVPVGEALFKQHDWEQARRQKYTSGITPGGIAGAETAKSRYRAATDGDGLAFAGFVHAGETRDANFQINFDPGHPVSIRGVYYEETSAATYARVAKLVKAQETGVMAIANNGTEIVVGPTGLILVRNNVLRWQYGSVADAPLK